MGLYILLTPSAATQLTPEQVKPLEELYSSYINHSDVTVEVDMLSYNDIESLNADTRGIKEATDVLSFPTLDSLAELELLPKEVPILLGSIVICPEKAEQYGETLLELVHHAMLHIIGYDHETGESTWDIQEQKILSSLREQGVDLRSRKELALLP
jgi:probable rRNA maturation factor